MEEPRIYNSENELMQWLKYDLNKHIMKLYIQIFT